MRIIQLYKTILPKSMHSLSALYLEQVSLSLVIKVCSVLISLVYIPLVLGFLNQEKYGIWITLTTVVNWIRVLDVGMGNGMRNKLAESIALKQYDKGRIYISTTYGILGSIFLLVLILFYFINPFLNWQSILNSEMVSPAELGLLTSIVFSFIILGFILQPVTLIYEAHGNSAAGGIIQLIISSISFILIWIVSVFATKGNIIILAWIVTGIPVLVYIAASIYTFSYRYPHLRPSIKHIKIKESGNLLHLSAQFFVLQITATIVFSSIPFVVTQLFSPNEVTIYNIANSIFSLPIMVMGIITAPLLPLVTQAYARNDYAWLKSMLKKMNLISLFLTGGIVIMIFISPYIYHIWIGNKVTIPFNLSVAIGIYTILNVLVNPFSLFLNGIGKIRILVILAPVGIGMFIGFSILLSHLIGNVIAVAIALSINSIVGLIIVPLTLKKYKLL